MLPPKPPPPSNHRRPMLLPRCHQAAASAATTAPSLWCSAASALNFYMMIIGQEMANICHGGGGCRTMPFLEVVRCAWLAMLGFVSVGSTTQISDIFVCRRHVANVGPTRRQHSVMSANILAVSVVSGNFVADTFSYT
jgi:hypothetical protein